MDFKRTEYEALLGRVLGLRDPETGVWSGELASSALATALAASALAEGGREDRRLAVGGEAWLAAHANEDGGWGDTAASVSNLSTTLIVAGALRAAGGRGRGAGGDGADGAARVLERARLWLSARMGGEPSPAAVARALSAVYGRDRTFAVPILAFLALCGEDAGAWKSVPPLPFLMALLPRGLYRFLRLQVVSYALPALIAVGLCRHVCVARASGRLAWGRLFAGPLLRRLERLQPSHGGFLDAIPLTAFVCLSLRHAGYGGHAVAQKGLAFLRQAARPDGSWAIDSNLRTWVTSLAVRGVARKDGEGRAALGVGELERIAGWLVRTQWAERHPFTGARPGGWAWTDLPGGVPDADDTSGALLALRRLKDAGCRTDVSDAARNGVRWLLGLQNADGGMPTFCRGWGRLPFDRSCPDISAHALAALAAWGGRSPAALKAMGRLIRYLARAQAPDGSWTPLWFGHQASAGGRNPVIGTARVVEALRAAHSELGAGSGELGVGAMRQKGEAWLAAARRTDGGWGMGGEATVEETALAVIALTGAPGAGAEAARRGCVWLAENWRRGAERPAPIGLYFALLWYHESLYPLAWALEALGLNLESL